MNLFRKIQPEDVIRQQLHEAQVHALEHQASAEHYQALADMYAKRAERLQAIINTAKPDAK